MAANKIVVSIIKMTMKTRKYFLNYSNIFSSKYPNRRVFKNVKITFYIFFLFLNSSAANACSLIKVWLTPKKKRTGRKNY